MFETNFRSYLYKCGKGNKYGCHMYIYSNIQITEMYILNTQMDMFVKCDISYINISGGVDTNMTKTTNMASTSRILRASSK